MEVGSLSIVVANIQRPLMNHRPQERIIAAENGVIGEIDRVGPDGYACSLAAAIGGGPRDVNRVASCGGRRAHKRGGLKVRRWPEDDIDGHCRRTQVVTVL